MSDSNFKVGQKCFEASATRKRKRRTSAARDALERKRPSEAVMEGEGDAHVSVLGLLMADNNDNAPDVDVVVNPNHLQSASAKKLQRFHGGDDNRNRVVDGNQRSWVLVECSQLTALLADLLCPHCENGQLSVSVGDKPMGWAQQLVLACSNCPYRRETYSSPRINNQDDHQNVSFEVNRQAVVLTHETGEGYSLIEKFGAVFGMHPLNKK